MVHHRAAGARAGRSLRSALVGVLAAGALVGAATPALAVPSPPNPTDSQLGNATAQQNAAAAEVGRVAGLVAGAETDLERAEVQAEAAGTAYDAAEEALQEAADAATATAARLRTASAAVAAAQGRIATFSHDSYVNGNQQLSGSAALLDSSGPGELIQRAALLDYVASNQVDVLAQLQVAKVGQANADSAARKARDTMAAATAAAAAAKATAERRMAEQRATFTAVTAQKATYEAQLKAAQIRLLQLQGARNAYQKWAQQKRAEEAAAAAAAARAARAAAEAAGTRGGSAGSDGYVKPGSGRVSSCFGWRWGALHGGVDIAAAIGTPIYAATDGVVKRAGAATGFGEAVYIRGDDGAVTVYGHVNRYFVNAGERVSAGQQIAEVGNRGQSTGPHLHFEVHPSGRMYGGQVDPVPWLNARGIYLGGCGG
ncbi:MAG TPA: M23 family metallopeptidase [Blastococcus sp.]|jgi:murein DD-endopeptidase MepM/ murein hydrolase activator NlpD|nr:M23 family metallopeptidase [Blastococcus sp.]